MIAWLAGPDGKRLVRDGVGTPDLDGVEAVIEAAEGSGVAERGAELRFRPGSGIERPARRRAGTSTATSRSSAWASATAGCTPHSHPDPLERLWSALTAVHAGDVLVSLAPGYETVDWGGTTHVGGGSHGALEAGDSLVPMLMVGFDDGIAERREQWKLCDAAGLVAEHFGHRPAGRARRREGRGVSTSDVFRRIHLGTKEPENWMQLLRFAAVGASGYVGQPRRLRGAGRGPRRPPHPRRDRRLLRRRHQQLPLEPPLDLRRLGAATPATRRGASSPSRSSAWAQHRAAGAARRRARAPRARLARRSPSRS